MKYGMDLIKWLVVISVIISLVFFRIKMDESLLNPSKANVASGSVQHSPYKYDRKQFECIRQALWHESRGEGAEGIKAVAGVIVNRVKSGIYPDDYCSVIHQPKQFSYVHELQSSGKPLSIDPKKSEVQTLKYIDDVSIQVLTGSFKNPFDKSVLWYHAKYVKPKWSKVKQKVATIGSHLFYKKQNA